jgi:hypothetical protein
MKKKTKPSKKVSIEFDEKHLGTLATALEVYSRLRSGQIKIAMDTAFWDKDLTYQDGEVLESMIRTIVFYKEEDITKNRNCYYLIETKHSIFLSQIFLKNLMPQTKIIFYRKWKASYDGMLNKIL